MNQHIKHLYDDDEISRILRRALKLGDAHRISHGELMDTARQIGLDPQLVEIAIKEEQREYKKQQRRRAVMQQRKAGFQRHLWAYLIVNAFLILTNKMTPGPWWSHWSLMGWGIGLAFHFKALYFPGRRPYGKRIYGYTKRARV